MHKQVHKQTIYGHKYCHLILYIHTHHLNLGFSTSMYSTTEKHTTYCIEILMFQFLVSIAQNTIIIRMISVLEQLPESHVTLNHQYSHGCSNIVIT